MRSAAAFKWRSACQLDDELEHQTCRDSTVGSPKPMGTRGTTTGETLGTLAD